MTAARLTKRRTTLEKNSPAVIAALVDGNTHAEVARQFKVSREAVGQFQDRHLDEIEGLKREIAERTKELTITTIEERIRRLSGLYDDVDAYQQENGLTEIAKRFDAKTGELIGESISFAGAVVAAKQAILKDVAQQLDQWPRGTGASTAIGVEVVIRTLIGVRDEDIK